MKRHPIQLLGAYVGIAGGAILGMIFLTVLFNGTWPAILKPFQSLFGTISNWTGDLALIIEIWLFIGPGALIYYWGKSLTEQLNGRDL